MKKDSIKLILVSVILILGYNISNAQFSVNRGAKTAFVFAIGGGGSGVEGGGYSLTGGNISFEMRKPLAELGANANFSANVFISANMGTETVNKEDKFGFLPTGLVTINYNTHSQSSLAAKNAFGGFLGVGLLVVPSQSIDSKDFDGNDVTLTTGMVGPAINFGPRFRLGTSYMDLRFYGGVTFGGDKDMTYGGMNLMFTLGMGKKKHHSMR